MKLIGFLSALTLITILDHGGGGVDGKTIRISKERQLEKNPSLKYFLDDDEFSIKDDDENDEKPPTIFTGDLTKSKILQQENKNHGQGKFKYSLETQNGIEISQVGKLKDSKTLIVMGSYAYTGADGKRYRVRYTADEFGYHPITSLELVLPDIEPPVPTVPNKVSSFSNKFDFDRKQSSFGSSSGGDGTNPDDKSIANRFGANGGAGGNGNGGKGGFAGYDRNANAYGYQGANGNSGSNGANGNGGLSKDNRLTQGGGNDGGAGLTGPNGPNGPGGPNGPAGPNGPSGLNGPGGPTGPSPDQLNAGNPFRNQGNGNVENVDRKYLPPTDYLPPTEEYLPPNNVLPPFV